MTAGDLRRSTAPGKLLLFGEHAAVYGYPALGLALRRGITVTYTPSAVRESTGWSLRIRNGENGRAAPPSSPEMGPFFLHLEETLARFGSDLTPLLPGAIEVSTALPIGSGFGSSAALCTALARLCTMEDALVWRVAHDLERFFHGTPSGIDTGLSALGGTRAFRFSRPGELPEAVPCALPELALVVGSVPRERDTRTLVAQVRRRREENPVETEQHLRALGEICRAVIDRGSASDVSTFGAAMNRAQEYLRHLGLSNALVDDILARATAAGARGAKISGAGGGGAFYLACEDEITARAIEDAVRPLLPPEGALFTMGTGGYDGHGGLPVAGSR